MRGASIGVGISPELWRAHVMSGRGQADGPIFARLGFPGDGTQRNRRPLVHADRPAGYAPAQPDRCPLLHASRLPGRGGGCDRGTRRPPAPLTTLAQRCRAAEQDHWPALIAHHFTELESASRGGEGTQELRRQTYLRLLPADAFDGEAAGDFRYTRQPAEGLLTALALDSPGSIRMLNDNDVARAGLDELWAAGRANLLGEPVEHVEVRGPSGALLHSVHGDSHFVASKALVLPELVRTLTGQELPDAGALVIVPTRHLLAFHPIVDGTVVDAVNDLGTYALGAYEDGPGSSRRCSTGGAGATWSASPLSTTRAAPCPSLRRRS
ncbi:hypothetical protein NKH18_28330 [Streptomyces sp. M10(2022)]